MSLLPHIDKPLSSLTLSNVGEILFWIYVYMMVAYVLWVIVDCFTD